MLQNLAWLSVFYALWVSRLFRCPGPTVSATVNITVTLYLKCSQSKVRSGVNEKYSLGSQDLVWGGERIETSSLIFFFYWLHVEMVTL